MTNFEIIDIISTLNSKKANGPFSIIDSRNYSCGIFIDLCKVFDTVDHHILLDKLEYYGIRGITYKWFCSYLSSRRQYVCLGTMESDAKKIQCGLPQGSILGPLLFLIYVNDLKIKIYTLLS